MVFQKYLYILQNHPISEYVNIFPLYILATES